MTEKQFTQERFARVLSDVAFGASEEDLVNSGLEDTMVSAYQEIRELGKQHDTDLRTGAFISAINKIARSYLQMGIFP